MDETEIVEIEEILTWKSMSKIAILYLGFEKELLEKIWEGEKNNVTGYIRKVIEKWQNRGDRDSKPQKFADILYDSGEVYHEDVKSILNLDRSKDKVEITEPKSRRKLSARKLAQLSDVITGRAMETIALKYMGASFTKVDNNRYAGNGQWWFTLGFLVDYSKTPGSSPEKLKTILFESNEVNKSKVEEILTEECEPSTSSAESKEKTAASPAKKTENNSKEPTSSEVDGGVQPKDKPSAGQQADCLMELC